MTDSSGVPPRYTFRSFLIGGLLSALVVYMSHYSVNIIHGSYLSIDHMPAGGIFLFFILVGLLVPLLRAAHPRLALNSCELILVYTMMLVTSSIVTMGLGSQFLSILAGLPYYATPANQWDTVIRSHVHPWFIPQDEEAVRTFFEGLRKGEAVPWSAWAKPLAVWLPFIFVLYFVMICTSVMIRRQWIENERLAFPLTELPLEMVRASAPQRAPRRFFRNPVMWIGFSIPFFIGTLNALHTYNDSVPQIQLVENLYYMRRFRPLQFRVSFPIIGLAFFISARVSFGLWFFNLLAQFCQAALARTGLESYENLGSYGARSVVFKHLGLGALVTLVLFGLWTGRAHLKKVVSRAVGAGPEEDDREEILPFPVAFWGWIAGVLAMAAWLHVSGLPLGYALAFVLLALAIFVGVMRVVAQGGVPTLIAPSIAPSQVISSVGCAPLGAAGLTTLGYTYIWCADIRTFAMSAALHGMKLDSEVKPRSHRPLFWAMALAAVIAVGGSVYVIMHQAYRVGGVNLNHWYFNGNIHAVFRYIARKIESPTEANTTGWVLKGVGALIMLSMMALQRLFHWWPIHPLGFAIGANGWMDLTWFSIFLAWLIKSALMKYGGGATFRKSRHFFLGLVLGQYSCSGFWFALDALTGKTGNVVFWI